MHAYPTGFIVQLSDLDPVPVADARECVVTDAGELVLTTGETELRRFSRGAWVRVDRLGTPLRSEWPPADFDSVMAELGRQMVVGFGMDFRYGSERFLDPQFNDFNALVDALVELEGGIPGYDSEYRRWISKAVSAAFAIKTPRPAE